MGGGSIRGSIRKITALPSPRTLFKDPRAIKITRMNHSRPSSTALSTRLATPRSVPTIQFCRPIGAPAPLLLNGEQLRPSGRKHPRFRAAEPGVYIAGGNPHCTKRQQARGDAIMKTLAETAGEDFVRTHDTETSANLRMPSGLATRDHADDD